MLLDTDRSQLQELQQLVRELTGHQPSTFRLPATLSPERIVDIYAKTSGYVGTLRVDIGARVHKGDVLLTIDVPEAADELRSAEASLAARTTHEFKAFRNLRTGKLKGGVSKIKNRDNPTRLR